MKATCLLLLLVILYACNERKPASKTDARATVPATAGVPIGKAALLEETIVKIIDAYAMKEGAEVSNFIHKDEGIVTLYRIGVFNEYKRTALFDFEKPVPLHFRYFTVPNDLKLQYGAIPEFDCGTDKWDKYGLYCDTVHKNTMLSGALENLVKYRGDKIQHSEIERLKQLEKKSVRVAVVAEGNAPFIFYLTYIKGRWYFTAHDRVTSDCSA